MGRVRRALQVASDLVKSAEFEEFMMNADDFISRRDEQGSATTQISQTVTSLSDAAQVLNRSLAPGEAEGAANRSQNVNIISPVVMPRNHRSWWWLFVIAVLAFTAGIGGATLGAIAPNLGRVLFGWHFWALLVAYGLFSIWKNSFVMIPDGCQALITRFGKVVTTVNAGRHYILHPWNRVSYIVNVTKEYPYNAPIREAPTKEQVTASVDLFLQFRINEPREFIFRLGGVNGFSEKLQNAISEQTRALIYSQRAEDIYDLIGESTNVLLASLNEQFMPAVEFVNANITHAEPSSQEYRMDLAAAEMVRVAKEAYTYQYELDLRKKRDEGDLEKELASLRETLSAIQADIAGFEAQITTAHEKQINRANAYAALLMVEAESDARANVALFEAQALDIRALRSAEFPEILDYRFQQQVLEQIAAASDRLPQIINLGDGARAIDYVATARELLGIQAQSLYSIDELAKMQSRSAEIGERIRARQETIHQKTIVDTDDLTTVEEVL